MVVLISLHHFPDGLFFLLDEVDFWMFGLGVLWDLAIFLEFCVILFLEWLVVVVGLGW